MTETGIRALTQNEFSGRIGMARADITPPEGMYARTWGSSTHDIADGVHRPLLATCVAILPEGAERPIYLLSLDLMSFMSKSDEDGLRQPLIEDFGLQPDEFLMTLAHTHGAPFTDLSHAEAPGGHLIQPFRDKIGAACRQVMTEAREGMAPAVLSWATGCCRLAYNRELRVPGQEALICGLNPEGSADDTLLVGRITGADGAPIGTLVNYACHPTSVGGANRLISPDFPGALREVVEAATGGGICLFINGASGELTPRRSFEDDVEAADQNGRELAYAVLQTLESLAPPGEMMTYVATEPSGADLARWAYAPNPPATAAASLCDTVTLEMLPIRTEDEIRAEIAVTPKGFMKERLERELAKREKVGNGPTFEMPVYAWKLGRSVFVGVPAELYSAFQIDLRARFPGLSIVVMNICNGGLSYLPSRPAYDTDVYPVRIAMFAAGSMERVRGKAEEMIAKLVG
jgi:hypothetical protein